MWYLQRKIVENTKEKKGKKQPTKPPTETKEINKKRKTACKKNNTFEKPNQHYATFIIYIKSKWY